MGKAKKGGKGGGAAAAAPKCTCDHPFKCTCGNRPERPSKGHKWDPEEQAWGGKGHKQKGASGQTALVDKKAQTTQVGGTSIQTWQKLPSALLTEFAKKEKFLKPKFKALDDKPGKYKYRVILPDPKDSKKDLFFVPPSAVANEEQAKEEAALLALVHITPKIPHERTLPEPYRTTWLTAIQQLNAKSSKTPQSQSANTTSSSSNTSSNTNNKGKGGGAQASTNLLQGARVTSQAQQEKKSLEQRKARNEKIRRHEAIRMANRNPRVTMTAKIRKIIESLLRGDAVTLKEVDEDDATEATLEEADNDAQLSVEDRLCKEGFTPLQARKSYQNTQKGSVNQSEDNWDNIYEECLQWLLLHVDEEDLPDGFNSNEGHLEVVGAEDGTTSNTQTKRMNAVVTPEGRAFAERYGLSPAEAALVMEQTHGQSPEATFWKLVLDKAQMSDLPQKRGSIDAEESQTQLDEEMEALQAIFDEGCQVDNRADGMCIIKIKIESDVAAQLTIQVRRGRYPSVYPEQVLVSSSSWPKPQTGTALHCQIAEFMGSLALDEPAIFEIHGFVTSLLDTLIDVEPISLIPDQPTNSTPQQPPSVVKKASPAKTNTKAQKFRKAQRPREKSPFWSIPPAKTPAATAFPKLGPSLQRARASLPAATARQDFLDLLKKSQDLGRVVLLTGETGCGKSTQIPQFILEENPSQAKIVVCQPRRVAATGVATRVAEERGENSPGVESVGYVVRGDSAICNKSRLVFCTTGVLLRQMQSENAFDALTHIVLDEVHERSLDMDILLALLKEKLPKHPNLTVVLMSATLQEEKFAAYWGRQTPRIHIPGRTFPVKDYLLDDVLEFTKYMPPKGKGKSKSIKDGDESADERDTREINGVRLTDLVDRVDESTVDYKLVAALVKHIITTKAAGDDGSILIFLPGAPEIGRALDTVANEMRGISMVLLPLHGGLQPSEQRKVFGPVGPGRHKVIFSTNIAETSVTIPDCTSVIDCAREKQSSYDPSNRMPLLIETFCSKASLKQRRGRAGRVRPGTCYKLISNKTFQRLKSDTDPEILRCALDQTLLSLLFLGIDCRPNGSFMPSLLDPPGTESLESSLDSLQIIGAVDETKNALTPLGMHIAGIPAPPIVGKILILGSMLGCRDAGLAMGAGMSLGRSPLLRIDSPRRNDPDEDPIDAMKRKDTLEARRNALDQVGKSDHAYLAKLFMDWDELRGPEKKRYCEHLGLSIPGMREMLQLKQQFDSALASVGYRHSKEANKHSHLWSIIRAVAVSGMSPSQLVKVVRPAQSYQETAEGAKEKEGRAQELKFFVRTSRDASVVDQRSNEERVFIHPSSGNFSVGNYSCPWLVYNSLVRTSKPFLRDVTECNEYSLLLFGGDLEIQASQGVVVIDSWCKLSASPKIGTLVGGIRRRLDELLTLKVLDPSLDIAATAELQIISRLIRKGGS
eukprot:CAMPEP_0172441418 /NCGR_PEP_ID=MMETSP1065-20121228/1967_1 /TAXON_ID=265537 /ORGANISM="Amphiprora paludosa, Strain CCMP125" /LENGTH=1439 /DNA_ID=CAMNT_0013190781 /DNA_START=22 /DNA_END=4341 /DNA_ORIENTATION=-